MTPVHNGRPVSPTKHSTCVAEKALGTTYGVAKEARLIPVLLGFVSGSSITQGFKQVIDDLTKDKEDAEKENREPTRYAKSVLIISAATKQTFDKLPLDRRPYTLLREYLSKLTTMGLPIVAAAGNRADASTGDVEVKQLPAWYASGQLFPIIDVGAAGPEGNIISTSRRGDKVSIYADGKDIQCSAQVQSGTSFTAAQVGGGIAVAMSQTEGPFYEATQDMRLHCARHLPVP
ncbi:subtilase [Penicillium hispanicum]|uniref:subtilase n=1 Tax=Penicillium hispanicum TaxID=1080232 RepID=UPI00253FC203|nr:subtilase [Penicillium hispanicum]KAJ5578557.1 subtilase [Penicillium hispanicum]